MTLLEANPNYGAYSHALERAQERYSLDLGSADLDLIISRITRGGPGVVPLRRSVANPFRLSMAVSFERTWVALVYDEWSKCVITVLPACELEPYSERLAWVGRRLEG